ncbi:MAG: ATP-binding protein, partial [Bryobacteraceae bacterium]
WYACVNSGEPFQIEYRFWNHQKKRYRWQLGRALPVRDASSNVVKWFGTATDIDDQKRTEEALRQANHDLEQFAFSASHDLQEPLRNVAIYGQLLKKRYGTKLDADGDEFLGYIVEGALRMETLLRGLLTYTQVTGSSEEEQAPSVDPNAVMKNVVSILHGAIDQSQAVITCDHLPELRVQEIHLQQLFQNLLANALKYRSTEPPSIHVSARRYGLHWTFSVRDNGIGIDPMYKQQVFGIFKRLHTREKYSGAGIGLAICQKIVERYGGRIWVESEVGKGSTFIFSLPQHGVDRHG